VGRRWRTFFGQADNKLLEAKRMRAAGLPTDQLNSMPHEWGTRAPSAPRCSEPGQPERSWADLQGQIANLGRTSLGSASASRWRIGRGQREFLPMGSPGQRRNRLFRGCLDKDAALRTDRQLFTQGVPRQWTDSCLWETTQRAPDGSGLARVCPDFGPPEGPKKTPPGCQPIAGGP